LKIWDFGEGNFANPDVADPTGTQQPKYYQTRVKNVCPRHFARPLWDGQLAFKCDFTFLVDFLEEPLQTNKQTILRMCLTLLYP